MPLLEYNIYGKCIMEYVCSEYHSQANTKIASVTIYTNLQKKKTQCMKKRYGLKHKHATLIHHLIIFCLDNEIVKVLEVCTREQIFYCSVGLYTQKIPNAGAFNCL